MDILSVLGQVRSLLQQEGRLSYRILKRQFALDDEALDDLKYELIEVQELAVDKDGKMLVWTGGEGTGESAKRRIGASETLPQPPTPGTQPPSSYTPAHLAERIRITAHLLLHAQRRIQRPLGMIFMGQRRAEQGKDAIAQGLRHVAVILMHGVHHQLQRRINNRPRLFRV